MTLPEVALGDPHVSAHNNERSAINALQDLSDPVFTAGLTATIGAEVADPTSVAGIAISEQIGTPQAATQVLLKKLKRGQQDAKILVLGDSTSNDPTEWPTILAGLLSGDWTGCIVRVIPWSGTAWGAPVTVGGSGPRTLDVYNASIAGWVTTHVLAPYFNDIVAATQPDLTIINLGHNDNAVTADFYSRYSALTESVMAAAPDSGLICLAQNPKTSDNTQALKAQQIEQLCAARGYGLIDIHQMFVDRGDYSSWMYDSVHPNLVGHAAIAAEIHKSFTYRRGAVPAARQMSSLLLPGENLVKNGDFSAFAGAVPDNWAAVACTTTKDTSSYESPNGYSVVVTDLAGVAVSYIHQALPVRLVRGGWVTVSARVLIGTSEPYSSGCVGVIDSAGTTNSLGYSAADRGKGGWRWETVSRFIPASATTANVRVYSSTISAFDGGVVRVDRIVVRRGRLPGDVRF